MARVESVHLPPEIAAPWKEAVKAVRVALLATEGWASTQSQPVQLVLGRAAAWWKRSIEMTESFIVVTTEE